MLGGNDMFVINRGCAVLATNSSCKPTDHGFTGSWVVHDSDGKLALEPMQSMLKTPMNAVVTPTVEDGAALLKRVKDELMPDMTDYSGVSMCILHAEAILDTSSNALMAQVVLFPIGFMSLADMQAAQAANIANETMVIKPEPPESTGDGSSSESKIISIVPGTA